MEIIKYNKTVNEKMYINMLPSNIKCYIIPKKGYIEKQAMIAFNYGSSNNEFEVNGNNIKMPLGIAHFLEHKLFEEKATNVFDQFSKTGANVNAFTNFTSTAYYFNSNNNFYESLELLLGFVSRPYFTEENVEKEKGIIAQEINMYDDDPMWCVYFNMLDAMYYYNPVKYNIAGNVEAIKKITKDMLYDCYNNFYTYENAVIVCCGEFENDKIYKIIEQNLKLNNSKNVKKIYGNEPDNVKSNYISKKMQVDRTIFNIGFKETNFNIPVLDKICATKLLLDIMTGESSSLYEKLYNRGIIDASFSYEYSGGLNFGSSIISGFSDNPEEVQKCVIEEINKFKQNGICEETFERIKKKHIGRFIRGFNSIDAIASSQIDYFSKNVDLFDCVESYKNIQKDFLIERLKQHFDENNIVMSLITSK